MKNNKINASVPVYHDFFKHEERLVPIADVLEIKKPFTIIDSDKPKIYHTDGLINEEFKELTEDKFLNYLNEQNIEALSFDIGPSALKVKPCSEGYWVAKSEVLSKDKIKNIMGVKIEDWEISLESFIEDNYA